MMVSVFAGMRNKQAVTDDFLVPVRPTSIFSPGVALKLMFFKTGGPLRKQLTDARDSCVVAWLRVKLCGAKDSIDEHHGIPRFSDGLQHSLNCVGEPQTVAY